MQYVPPSVSKTAFNCSYCGAFAKQLWFSARAKQKQKDETPIINERREFEESDVIEKRFARYWRGLPVFSSAGDFSEFEVGNVWFSQCYNCDNIALWVYDKMIYPQRGEAPPANPDMPEKIRRDYDEASTILDLSPRGAAALLRLSVENLCGELGDPAKSINENIKAMVASGLDRRVQQALDAVRVVGNNAVHPGQIDLKDDRALAESLFRLLNLIVERMISEPKHVDDLYASLPESARQAVAKRDGK
jgi:hypothetical protein